MGIVTGMENVMSWFQPVFNIMVSGLGGGFFVWLLVAGTKEKAVRKGKRRYLSYGKGFKAFALLLIPLAAFVVWLMLINVRGQEFTAFLVASGFVAGAIFFPYQAFLIKFSYDDNFIYYQSPLAGDNKVSWKHLSEIGYDWFLQTDYIFVDGIGKIYCSNMMNGTSELGIFLEKKTRRGF